MAGPLDLSDANTKGFEPLEAGQYDGEVFEITWDAVKNEGGKLPKGTPMLKVQFKLTGEGVENRRVFTQYAVPPKGYDKEKAATMKGMIARFFMAVGFSEEQVKSKDFEPDFEELKGREVTLTIGKEQKRDRASGDPIEGEFNNPVKNVKPIRTATASGGLL